MKNKTGDRFLKMPVLKNKRRILKTKRGVLKKKRGVLKKKWGDLSHKTRHGALTQLVMSSMAVAQKRPVNPAKVGPAVTCTVAPWALAPESLVRRK